MHTDFAVLTGAHHTAAANACQDFCLADSTAERAWAVVADGCSTGRLSDLGARAWALAARHVLTGLVTVEADPDSLRQMLLERVRPRLADLEFADGFSTLGMLQTHAKLVHATFFGDGALLVRRTDGSQMLVNLQCTANAPYYLNYLLNPEANQQWLTEFATQELLTIVSQYGPDGELETFKSVSQPATQPWQWQGHVDADDLELVVIATDGVASRVEGFVATGQALLAVKSATGEFLRRRVARAARDWATSLTMPADDLAAAAVWLGPETTNG